MRARLRVRAVWLLRRRASLRAPSSYPFAARIAARAACARVARRLLPAARGLPRALPCFCQDEGRRDPALLALAISAFPLRRAAEHRALLLRLRRPTRRAATADMRFGCGLLYHLAISERFRRRPFALEPSFRPRAQDANGRRMRPGLSARS